MLNGLLDLLRMSWTRFHPSSASEFLFQTPNEQIEQSWARLIRSYDDVPDVYQSFFSPNAGKVFPYTVLTPSFNGFIHNTTQKLVCAFEHEICVLERKHKSFGVCCYPLERISYVEVKTLLLYSSIKISGITKDGISASSTIQFNSTTDFLFTPILNQIRGASIRPNLSAHNIELMKFDSWRSKNFKFMNYARRSLLTGEQVIYTILQPETRESVINFMGWTYDRFVYPTLAFILTDHELIMIQEEKVRSGDDKYGGIWHYIPLKKILTVSLLEHGHKVLKLSIQLTDGTRLEHLIQPSVKREVDRLQYYICESLIA